MIRSTLGVLVFASAACGQADKPAAWDFDARRKAIDDQFAGFAKLGFDPKGPAPEGDAAEFRKRTAAATGLFDAVRTDLARYQAAVQGELDAKAKARNEAARRFRAANTVAASNLHFLDKVAANPTKAGLEKNLDGYARDWDTRYGQDLKRLTGTEDAVRDALKPYLPDAGKAGYEPHGAANPFVGAYHARFYDDTGAVAAAVWTGGVDGWKRYQADAKGQAARLRERGAEIEKKAEEMDAAFTGYEATVRALEDVVGPAADKLNRAELVGTWKGELVQGANKIGVTLAIEADGKISNTAATGQSGKGTWARSGEKVTVVWATGEVAAWTLKDGKLGGGGTTPRGEKWTIGFTKE